MSRSISGRLARDILRTGTARRRRGAASCLGVARKTVISTVRSRRSWAMMMRSLRRRVEARRNRDADPVQVFGHAVGASKKKPASDWTAATLGTPCFRSTEGMTAMDVRTAIPRHWPAPRHHRRPVARRIPQRLARRSCPGRWRVAPPNRSSSTRWTSSPTALPSPERRRMPCPAGAQKPRVEILVRARFAALGT